MSKIVVVDYGHGGTDPGATYKGLREKDLTLQIGRKISAALRSNGVRVIETRTKDQTVSLNRRSQIANTAKADLFVSVHINSAATEKANGVETFSHPNSKNGAKLAKAIQDELVRTGLFKSNRGVKTANFFVLRNTSMPASLVELGFIKNPHDINVMTNKQDELAQAVTNGILTYLGIKGAVKPPSKPVKPQTSKPKPVPSKPKPSTSSWTEVKGNWTGQTLKRGQYGEPVRQLQELLASKHYYPNKGAKNNGIDGYFGADTLDAVKRYQSMHGLTVDGLPGKATYASLKGSTSKPKPKPKPKQAWTGQVLKQGSRGPAVRQLQEMLSAKHYYPDKGAPNNGVDGIYGAKTADAVRRYQMMHGLEVDGIAGRGTYNSLRK